MNNNLDNTSFENDNAVKQEELTHKKFKKIDILILIVCLAISFCVWCYAQYVADPIIEREVRVSFMLEGTTDNIHLINAFDKITVYGKRSQIASLTSHSIKISINEFSESDTIIYDYGKQLPSGCFVYKYAKDDKYKPTVELEITDDKANNK